MKLHRLFTFVALVIILFYAAVPNTSVGASQTSADVTLTKVAEHDSINKGETARFNINVKNIGTGTAQNVVLKDALSQSTGLKWSIVTPVQGCSISSNTLTCDFGNLAPGDTRTVNISSPTDDVACCCKISNTANVSASNEADAYQGNNSSTAKITVRCPTSVNVAVTKKAVKDPVDPGAPISFDIIITNTGSQAATAVTLTDVLPTQPAGLNWSIATPVAGCSITNNTLTCNFASLAAGTSQTVTVTSPTVGVACGKISNTATVSAGNESAGNDGDNNSTGEVTITCPPGETGEAAVTKAAVATPVDHGQQIGFVIKVTSEGPGTAKGVTLTDALPNITGLSWSVNPPVAGCSITGNALTCNFGDMIVNASQTVTVTSPTVGVACGKISNTAKVTASNEANPNDPDDSATATLELINCKGPTLEVKKLPQTQIVYPNTAGKDTILYTITVSNTGDDVAKGVVLDDQLHQGLNWSVNPPVTGCSITNNALTCNFGDIAPGGSATVQVSATAAAQLCGEPMPITNTAFAEAANFSRLPSDPAFVYVSCVTGVNVKVTKTAEMPSLFAGQPAVFTIVVINDSASQANGVVLTDALPAKLTWTWTSTEQNLPCGISANNLTCNFGTMASGDSHTLTITAPTEKYAGPITNTAVVSATNETTGNQGDNTATANTNVLGQACLSLTMFNGKYINDFEGSSIESIGIENYRHDVTPKGAGFLGQYAQEDSVALTLACLPNDGGKLFVSFNLFIIRSWDGNTTANGPDHWKFSVDNGPVLIDTTFTNFDTFPQAYPGNWPGASYPAFTGAIGKDVLGYTNSGNPNWPQDSLYYLSFQVPYTPGQPITLRFSGSHLQPLIDESWGIDNLTVVPLPPDIGTFKLFYPWVKQ